MNIVYTIRNFLCFRWLWKESKDTKILKSVMHNWDLFGHKMELSLPEFAKRMETLRIQYYGKPRDIPQEFDDDVK